MFRSCLLTGLIGILFLSPAFAQEDQGEVPKFLGKNSIQWMEILEKDKRFKYKRAAIFAMEYFGPAERGTIDVLTLVLRRKGEHPDIKQAAAQVLGRMGADAKAAVPALVSALATDENPKVRQAAAKALGGKMVPHSKRAVPELAEALAYKDHGVRDAAAASLKDLGKESRLVIDKVIKAVKDKHNPRFTRMYCAQLLSTFKQDGDRVLPILVATAQEKEADPTLRKVAVDGVAKFKKDSHDAGEALQKIFLEKDAPILLRKSAGEALVAIGTESSLVWPTVKKGLSDKNKEIREQAIRIAGKLCQEESELVPLLTKLCDESIIDLQLAAIQELGEIGPPAKAAIKKLKLLTKTAPRRIIREAAAKALKRIDNTGE